MAKLYRVIIPVSDIDKAQQFYSQIFDEAGTRVSPGRHYFDCEGTIFACYDPGADGDAHEARPNPDHVYLAVDDLEDCFARCSAAQADFDPDRLHGDETVLGEIAKRPWGELSFYIHDPFGNPICFVDRTTVFVG